MRIGLPRHAHQRHKLPLILIGGILGGNTLKYIDSTRFLDSVFLDGLAITLTGIPQGKNGDISYEEDFIYTLSQDMGGFLEYREFGAKGYPKSATIKGTLDNGFEWVVFCSYGSLAFNQHMNIECKGQYTEFFRDTILSYGVNWSLTRADIAMDMIIDFDVGHNICKVYSKLKNIQTHLAGDWEGRENGRTYYIGKSRKECESYIRFYEKYIEMAQKGFDGFPDNLQRLELEYKPKKHKRQHIKSLDAKDILSTALYPLELFNMFREIGVEPVRISGKKESNYKLSVRHMMTQYLSQIKEWKEQEGLVSLFEEIEYAIEHGHVVMG